MKKIISGVLVMSFMISAAQEPVEDSSWLQYINQDEVASEAHDITLQEPVEETVFLSEDPLQDYVTDKPFKCPVVGCDTSGFELKTSLVRHMNDKHAQKEIDATLYRIISSPYCCSIASCGKSYARKDRLARHQMKNHQTYPDEHVTQKIRKQPGEKKFVCPIPHCGKDFTRRYNLVSHEQKDHGIGELTRKSFDGKSTEKKISCVICNKAFSSRNSLTGHRKQVHAAPNSTLRSKEAVIPQSTQD